MDNFQNLDEVKKFEAIVRNLLKSGRTFEAATPLDTVSLFQQTYDLKEKRWVDHPTTFDVLYTVVNALVRETGVCCNVDRLNVDDLTSTTRRRHDQTSTYAWVRLCLDAERPPRALGR